METHVETLHNEISLSDVLLIVVIALLAIVVLRGVAWLLEQYQNLDNDDAECGNK